MTALVISKFLQILGLQPRISKVFSVIRTFFCHGRYNNFGNKIPCLFRKLEKEPKFKLCKINCQIFYTMVNEKFLADKNKMMKKGPSEDYQPVS